MAVTDSFLLSQNSPPRPEGSSNPVLNAIIWAAGHFIGLFTEAGKQFAGLVVGILPTLKAGRNGWARVSSRAACS